MPPPPPPTTHTHFLSPSYATDIYIYIPRAGLKPIGPITPSWAPRPILQTLVQVNWEPGPTQLGPAPPKAGPVGLHTLMRQTRTGPRVGTVHKELDPLVECPLGENTIPCDQDRSPSGRYYDLSLVSRKMLLLNLKQHQEKNTRARTHTHTHTGASAPLSSTSLPACTRPKAPFVWNGLYFARVSVISSSICYGFDHFSVCDSHYTTCFVSPSL